MPEPLRERYLALEVPDEVGLGEGLTGVPAARVEAAPAVVLVAPGDGV